MSHSENNKRIAKNTLMLYFRMIVVTLVSLFTVRIILRILGIVDFGIYNVVGGVVGFLGMLNGTMVSATQRFLTYELGKGDLKQFNRVFSMLMIIFLSLSVILFFIAIALGSWVVNYFLVIPPQRLNVALWLYYFSVVTFIFSLISIPYMSSIVANEKMNIYAYVSLIEVVLKLLLVYCLYISTYDKLLTYGFLTMLVTLFVTLVYRIYCVRKLSGCNFKLYWDRLLFKELIGYTSWNLFGSVTSILNNQGQSIILNIFFGPVVNAAKAIADKINAVFVSFSNNFYMAVRPQIIKSYAQGDLDNMFSLVYKSSKFSFYLLFVLTLPLIILMKSVLQLWLGQTTNDMIIFSQLVLVFSLVNVFEQPITVMIQSTGKIRNYEIVIGSITLILIPLSYLAFKFGAPAYYSMIILIFIYIVAHFFRLYIAKKQLGMSIGYYCRYIFVPIIFSSIPSLFICLVLSRTMPIGSVVGIILFVLSSFGISLISILLLGLNNSERLIFISKLKRK